MGLWLFTFNNQQSSFRISASLTYLFLFYELIWFWFFFSGQIWFLHVGLCYKVLHVQLLVGRWSRNMNDIWKGLDLNFTIMNMVISILQLVIWTELHLIFFYKRYFSVDIIQFGFSWKYCANCNFWILDNCIGATPFGNTSDMKNFFLFFGWQKFFFLQG